MSALGDIVASDLATIEQDMGSPAFTWQDETFTCLPGSAAETLVLGDGGLEVQADLVLNVRKVLFTDNIYPRPQQTLTYSLDNKTYRIASVKQEPLGVYLKIILLSAKKGV